MLVQYTDRETDRPTDRQTDRQTEPDRKWPGRKTGPHLIALCGVIHTLSVSVMSVVIVCALIIIVARVVIIVIVHDLIFIIFFNLCKKGEKK